MWPDRSKYAIILQKQSAGMDSHAPVVCTCCVQRSGRSKAKVYVDCAGRSVVVRYATLCYAAPERTHGTPPRLIIYATKLRVPRATRVRGIRKMWKTNERHKQ
eukprot:6207418-Pleurochrysis_carterae.AAC.4